MRPVVLNSGVAREFPGYQFPDSAPAEQSAIAIESDGTPTLIPTASLHGTDGADGADGRGFNPVGAWSSGGSYTVDDIATHGGQTFRAKLTHSSSSTAPADDATNWELWAAKGADGSAGSAGADGAPGADGADGADGSDGRGFNPVGAWSSGGSYTVDDIATHGGQTFRAKLTHSGSSTAPADDATNWELWAAKGATGATGATGAAGADAALPEYQGAGRFVVPNHSSAALITPLTSSTNQQVRRLIRFDWAAEQQAQVEFVWPTGWTTFKYRVFWEAIAGTAAQTVRFAVAARSFADGDDIDQAFGTAVNVDDALANTGKSHDSGWSSAVTPAGTVAAGNRTRLKLTRPVFGNLAQYAYVAGIEIKNGS